MSTHSGVRHKRQVQEVREAGLVIQRMSIHQAGTILWQPFYSVNYVSGPRGQNVIQVSLLWIILDKQENMP